MRILPFLFIGLTAGCTQDADHLGNPLLLPINGISTAIDMPYRLSLWRA